MSYKAALEYTQEALAEHELTQISDTCWKFAKPGTFNMGFFVAWAPGHLFFGGDIDTVTTVHYQAMSTPEGAASWVLNSSFDYWASKTGVKKIYDEDRTRDILKDWIDDLKDTDDERDILHRACLIEALDYTGDEFEFNTFCYHHDHVFDCFGGGYTYPQRMIQQHYALKQWAFAYLHTTQIPGVRTPTIEKGWP